MIQLPSNSTLLCDGVYCYKKPLYKSEVSVLGEIIVEQTKPRCPPKHVVLYTRLSSTFFMYPKVLYDPLTFDEAEPCLNEVIIKVHAAIEELHDLGFQHGDVRFPNICYNRIFNPVLIDLDQASAVVPGISYDEDVQCFANEILNHLITLKHLKAAQNDDFLRGSIR